MSLGGCDLSTGLGIPLEEPLAVVQWNHFIANNYSSRKFGVKRGMSVQDGCTLCPKLHCIEVELIGAADADSRSTAGQSSRMAPTSSTAVQSSTKVSLERYVLNFRN